MVLTKGLMVLDPPKTNLENSFSRDFPIFLIFPLAPLGPYWPFVGPIGPYSPCLGSRAWVMNFKALGANGWVPLI